MTDLSRNKLEKRAALESVVHTVQVKACRKINIQALAPQFSSIKKLMNYNV